MELGPWIALGALVLTAGNIVHAWARPKAARQYVDTIEARLVRCEGDLKSCLELHKETERELAREERKNVALTAENLDLRRRFDGLQPRAGG